MKRILQGLSGIIVFLFLTAPAFAHMPGQAPYFEVDGKYCGFYNIPSTSLEDLNLPQDAPGRTFLVNEQINFKLDTTKLPVDPSIISKTKFIWDYGDGQKGSGLENTYAYKKMGTYVLSIYTDDGTAPTPQLLESVALQILPNASYQLPKPVISMNGFEQQDPINNPFVVPFDKPVTYDSSLSKVANGIKSMRWDFGDGIGDTKPTEQHSLPKDQRVIQTVLRITDKNGFIVDTYAIVKNSLFTPITPSTESVHASKINSQPNLLPFILGGALVVLALGLFLIRIFRRK